MRIQNHSSWLSLARTKHISVNKFTWNSWHKSHTKLPMHYLEWRGFTGCHCANSTTLMNLLTWCSHIPTHFHLSSVSCSMQSHCHVQHWLPHYTTSHATCASLYDHLHLTPTLISPITGCTIGPVSCVGCADGLLSRPPCTLSISS